jgi:4-carboxymuconolactone decarboxylase
LTASEHSNPTWSRDVIDAARVISAPFAAGLELIHRVIEDDGALPAAIKALFAAAAAANRGREQLMRTELARAAAAGISRAEADGAGVALLLARGEATFAAFAAAAAATFGDELRDGSGEPRIEVSAGGSAESDASAGLALEYFREHFGGEVPLRQRVMADIAPLAFQGYHLMHRAALKQNALSQRDVELLMCAINASDYSAAFLEIHVAGARAVGASEPQIAEAVVCAIPAGGIAVWPGAAEAIIRTR